MADQAKNECSEHPGEKKKLFCTDPCKTSLCQNCLKNHKKHEIRSFDDIIEELKKCLEDTKKEKTEDQILYGGQIETIDKLHEDTEKFLKKQIEEEKRMEQIVIEPLQDILNGFQDKVNTFLTSLTMKKRSCEIIEDQAYNKVKSINSDLVSLKALAKAEDCEAVYQKWMQYMNKSQESDESSDKEALLDIDTLKNYASDLKNLNVTEQMRIVVQSVTSALQMEKMDPIARFADKLTLSNEDMKALQESVINAQNTMKEVMTSLESMKKEMKGTIATAINLLKKNKEIEKAAEIIDRNEKTLSDAREKLISQAMIANSLFAELSKKQKDLSDMQFINIKTIADWKKGLQICEKENAVFKKQFGKVIDLLGEYEKDIVKYNMNYGAKIEELDDLDDKIQTVRGNISKHESKDKIYTKKKNYKFRISLISIGETKALAQELINNFLKGSITEAKDESLTGIKGYSIIVKLASFTVEFCLWNIGSLEEVKTIDIAYLKNVESVLLLYDAKASDTLSKIKETFEFLHEKTKSFIALSGLTKESIKEPEESIKNYALEMKVPFRLTNITVEDELNEMFYGILYAGYPELYECVKSQ